MSSSHQIDQSGDTKQFTITAFLAFAVVFAFLMLLSLWHGDFKPSVPGGETHTEAEK
jgi:hypothetical protein